MGIKKSIVDSLMQKPDEGPAESVLMKLLSSILICIDSEIGCIKDGNVLTPAEQDSAITVAKNIEKRIRACF